MDWSSWSLPFSLLGDLNEAAGCSFELFLMAIFLSLIIPGLGQLYSGRAFHGLAWFVVVLGGYVMLIFPGIIMHVFCLLDAGRYLLNKPEATG